MRKLFRYLADALFVLIMIAFAWVSLQTFISRDNPSVNKGLFGYRFYTVLSGSMTPGIQPGDAIAVKIVKPADIHTGDIVTFSMGTHVVTHRVVDADSNSVITKGDANNMEDGIISRDAIIGRFALRIPYLGYVNLIFSQPWLFIPIISGLFFIILYSLLCDMQDAKDEDDEQEDEDEQEEETVIV